MVKKQLFQIDYFDGYHLLAIVTHLKDYRLAFFLNRETESQFARYEDLCVGDDKCYSLYRYHRKEDHITFYLISNTNEIRKLIPSKKEVDYFLLIKDAVGNGIAGEMVGQIRKIKNVMAVFKIDMTSVKDMDLLLEMIELHEVEQKKQQTKNITKPK
jgi:hypothetical protein